MLSVLTWNILHPLLVKNHATFAEWPARCPLVISTIVEKRPDVVCLQEVDLLDQSLVSGLGQHGYSVVVKVGKKQQKYAERNPQKVHMTQLIAIRADSGLLVTGHEFQSRSMCVRVKRDGDPDELTIYNVHFEARAEEKHGVHMARFAHEQPVLICGDLNRRLPSGALAEFPTYRNAYDLHFWPIKTYKFAPTFASRVIDYVLFDHQRVSCVELELIDGPSDHFGVMAKFAWQVTRPPSIE